MTYLETDKSYNWKEMVEYLVSQIPANKNIQENVKEYTGISWGAYQRIKNGIIPEKNLIRKMGAKMALHGFEIKITGTNTVQIVKTQTAGRDNTFNQTGESNDNERLRNLVDENFELKRELKKVKEELAKYGKREV